MRFSRDVGALDTLFILALLKLCGDIVFSNGSMRRGGCLFTVRSTRILRGLVLFSVLSAIGCNELRVVRAQDLICCHVRTQHLNRLPSHSASLGTSCRSSRIFLPKFSRMYLASPRPNDNPALPALCFVAAAALQTRSWMTCWRGLAGRWTPWSSA